ncbi:hypothetical protein ACIQNI_29025 [Streptomyces sp. NPDC091266]|uniref:hypothetical protein n=1 Tax=Streptomyces sp. NPDC091266 TaxID=3365978 RepID=UPI003804D233
MFSPGHRCRTGGTFDGLQGCDHPSGGGVPYLGGVLQLVDGAVDALEQSAIDGELAAG